MKITAHNDRKVVVTHTNNGLIAAIVMAALFTAISVVLDAKHPILWISCTRHSYENKIGEDIDCSMIVRPQRNLFDLRLHEEFRYNFELQSAELTTTGNCKSSQGSTPQDHRTHIRNRRHRCHYVINLTDEKGHVHAVRHLETAQEAHRVYKQLTEFIQKTKDTPNRVSLAIQHDTSFTDEAAFVVDSGVLIRAQVNSFQCVCSNVVVSLENVVSAEVVAVDIFYVSAGNNAQQRAMKEYQLRVNINSSPHLDRSKSHNAWSYCCCCCMGLMSQYNTVSSFTDDDESNKYLELGMGTRFSDDANLRRVVEAITTVLLAYGRTFNDMNMETQHAHEGVSQTETQCVVCYNRTARILLLPCRHVPCCGPCSDRLTTCPLCRTTITSRVTAVL